MKVRLGFLLRNNPYKTRVFREKFLIKNPVQHKVSTHENDVLI